jgi:hypothetical protein
VCKRIKPLPQIQAYPLMSAPPPQEPEDPTPTPTAFDARASTCLDWVAVIDEALHHLKALLEEEMPS